MAHKYDFDGRTVAVTGAAAGIGRETALAFGGAGANVVVADVAVETGEDTASRITDQTVGTGGLR